MLSSDTEPFDIFKYFFGATVAYGFFEDRFGKVRKRFKVDIKGEISKGVLSLHESFQYDCGSSEVREWRIRQLSVASYEGEAPDVIGKAQGRVNGDTLSWRYDMWLEISGSRFRVRFDDQMVMLTDGVMLNRAKVSKCGVTLGQVVLSFHKLSV